MQCGLGAGLPPTHPSADLKGVATSLETRTVHTLKIILVIPEKAPAALQAAPSRFSTFSVALGLTGRIAPSMPRFAESSTGPPFLREDKERRNSPHLSASAPGGFL